MSKCLKVVFFALVAFSSSTALAYFSVANPCMHFINNTPLSAEAFTYTYPTCLGQTKHAHSYICAQKTVAAGKQVNIDDVMVTGKYNVGFIVGKQKVWCDVNAARRCGNTLVLQRAKLLEKLALPLGKSHPKPIEHQGYRYACVVARTAKLTNYPLSPKQSPSPKHDG